MNSPAPEVAPSVQSTSMDRQGRWDHPRTLAWIHVGTVVLGLVVMTFLVASVPLLRGYVLFHMDSITPAVFARSIFEEGEPLSGLMFGTQSFVFPQAPLYLIAYGISFLFGENRWAASLIINALLQFVVFSMALYLFGKALTRSKAHAHLFASVGTMVLTALLALGQSPAPEFSIMAAGRNEFNLANPLFFTATHHYAVAFGAPVVLALIVYCLRTKNTRYAVAATLVSAAVYASSGAWLPWFLLPLVVAAAILFLFNTVTGRTLMVVLVTSAGAMVLGEVFERILERLMRTDYDLGLFVIDRIPTSLRLASQVARDAWSLSGWVRFGLICTVIMLGVALVAGMRVLFRFSRGRWAGAEDGLTLVSGFVIIATVLLVPMAVLTGNTHIPRYFSMWVVYGLLGLLAIVAELARRFGGRSVLVALPVVAAVALGGAAYSAVDVRNPIAAQVDDPASCFAANGLDGDVIGTFIFASSFELYSGARAVWVSPDLTPNPWLMNDQAYATVQVKNVVVTGLDADALDEAGLGTPSRVVHCGAGLDIHHFDEPINDRLPW